MIDRARRMACIVAGIGAGIGAAIILAWLVPTLGSEEFAPPAPVIREIQKLAERNTTALIVKHIGDPWIVAVGTGRASAKVVQGMERDNATRAAVDVAKNAIAQLLAANVEVFREAATSAQGGSRSTHDVVVTVVGAVLSRVELHEARYDDSTQVCRVVIICPPPGKEERIGHVYADAGVAAHALLKRAAAGLCHTGVISVPVKRRGGGEPELVPIAITAGPLSQPGGREISRVKGQQSLLRFLNERIDSQDSLRRESMTVADPFDPDGSRILYSERFERRILIRQAGRLPPTVNESIEAGDVFFTATWPTGED